MSARVTKLTTELSPGDLIVRGHWFPRSLYTGKVVRVEKTDTGSALTELRVVCENGQWCCAASDQFLVEVAS